MVSHHDIDPSAPNGTLPNSKTGKVILFTSNTARLMLTHFLPLAEGARHAGFSVHVATPSGPDLVDIAKHGFTCHEVPISRSSTSPLREIWTIWLMFKLYRRIRPSVVHQFTIKPVLYGGIACRFARVPAVVNTITGLGYIFLANGLKTKMLRKLVIAAYRLAFRQNKLRSIFENPDDRALFLDAGLVRQSETLLVHGAGVDLDRYRCVPEPDGLVTVVLASRMLWDKGVGEFIEAAQTLSRRGVTARWILAGDSDKGNPSAIPEAQLNAWQSSGPVEWIGHVDNIPDLFANAHIICLPSYREGLPKVLIEAIACGRPVITTDVPGCREVVCDGVNGFLVPSHDAHTLADALQKLIENSDMRQLMGEAARSFAEQEFSVSEVVNACVGLYQSLLFSEVSSSTEIT